MRSRPATEPIERFMRYVEAGENGCLIWVGSRTKRGYGEFSTGGRGERHARAHRWYWEFTNGAVADGLVLDHLCRNKLCVNPDHLEPVTNAENLRRHFILRKACPRGHELTQANTMPYGKFGRRCRICRQNESWDGKYRQMTGEETERIIELLKSGMTQKEIARITGRHPNTISYVANRGKRDYAKRVYALERSSS